MSQKLFMIMLGCRPENRITEQHDLFFGIAEKVEDLRPAMEQFWPEGKHNLHIDVWREVTHVEGYKVVIDSTEQSADQLFFVNLGGYQRGVFDELHLKLLVAAPTIDAAVSQAKKTDFFSRNGFPGASAHIDEKFAFDVDGVDRVADLLGRCGFPGRRIALKKTGSDFCDEIHCGYFPLKKMS